MADKSQDPSGSHPAIDLLSRSPLDGAKYGTQDLMLREIAHIPMFELRVLPGTSLFSAVGEAIGVTLPLKVGATRKADDGTFTALTLAPDRWLIVGSTKLADALGSLRVAGNHLALVDVSAQRTTIEIGGERARDVLAHLWEQDLRDRSFPIDRCAQGLMAKAPVVLWRTADRDFQILVRASFAAHLWAALMDAAMEYVAR